MDTTLPLEDDNALAPARPAVWTLVIAYHPDTEREGRRAILSVDAPLLLGRGCYGFGAGALDDASVSRQHARVELNALGELQIEDVDSRNGTYLNGAKISRAQLRESDVVSIGNIMLVVVREVPVHDATVATSGAWHQVVKRVDHLATTEAIVVLAGEPGCGKDRLARHYHTASGRSGRFVALRCGATADEEIVTELFGRAVGHRGSDDPGQLGLLESAAGGVLYLDRIEDASDKLQASLLDFLDTREIRRVGSTEPATVDVRIVASTTRDHTDENALSHLRPAFVQRLANNVVALPPLRERRADILPLARELCQRFAGAPSELHRRLRLALLRHDYPGNVRELEAIAEAVVIDHEGDGPLRLTDMVRDKIGAKDPRASRVSQLSQLEEPFSVAASGAWFEVDGDRRDLSGRRTLRRLVAALATRRRDAPGAPMSLDDLLAAGWPGEVVLEEAGRNRVYVALTTLRKLGLRDVLTRTDDGYLLDPAVRARVVES